MENENQYVVDRLNEMFNDLNLDHDKAITLLLAFVAANLWRMTPSGASPEDKDAFYKRASERYAMFMLKWLQKAEQMGIDETTPGYEDDFLLPIIKEVMELLPPIEVASFEKIYRDKFLASAYQSLNLNSC